MTKLVMMDITGKVVIKTNVMMIGNVAEINFGDLESGLYLVDFAWERSKLQVVMKNGKREMVSEKWFGLFGSKF